MARSSSQHGILKAPPKPVEPPCPFCDDVYWRSNGRAWWACDRITGRRHACTPAARAEGQAVAAGQPDRKALAAARVRRQRRATTALTLGLATAVAVLAGIWIYASDTE